MRGFVAAGALLAFAAVLAGAFGAHVLKGNLPPVRLKAFETGVSYQLVHAVGLVLIGVIEERWRGSRLVAFAGWCLLCGILLFSGSLIGLALSGVKGLGIVAPFGGLAFLVGWLCLAFAAVRRPGEAS